jgi:hypothetical protein
MRIFKPGFLMLLLALGMGSSAIAQTTVGKSTLGGLKKEGATSISGAPLASLASGSQPRMKVLHDLVAARLTSMSDDNAKAASAYAGNLSVPVPFPNPVKNGGNNIGFEGLSTVDNANTNGGFVATPPDQGLCVGNGFVVEIINESLAVYDKAGTQLTAPISYYSFVGADFSTNFLADPRCYYDRPTQRWFFSLTNVFNSDTERSNLYLAVSETSDPRGSYTVYSIDTTDDGLDGTPSDPGCPCYGDQPLLGADTFGVYLSTNEFGLFSNAFNGSQVYALSKTELEAGTVPTLVHFGELPLAEGTAYSVQPASSPDLDDENGSGVEYFLSALDFTSTLDDRIAVWAMTNTRSLSKAAPDVSLANVVIHSEVYGFPPLATQKAGPYPLGMSLGDPLETLNTDDDRMQQVTFAGGLLWGELTTVVSDGTQNNAGIAYFVVVPFLVKGNLGASVLGQNYVSAKGASVIYPAVGVTAHGAAAVAYTLVGPSYFPSAAFTYLTPFFGLSVNIVALGGAPQDDFSGYPQIYPPATGAARWGDYSWAVADGDQLWLATEYIPGGIDSTTYLTNFGTFVYALDAF